MVGSGHFGRLGRITLNTQFFFFRPWYKEPHDMLFDDVDHILEEIRPGYIITKCVYISRGYLGVTVSGN